MSHQKRYMLGMTCAACFDAEPDAVWQAARQLEERERLVDGSHHSISLRACRACRQRFVMIFAERIDWVGGNDPQAWLLVPLGENETYSEALPRRRCLIVDFPSDGPLTARFGDGPFTLPHD